MSELSQLNLIRIFTFYLWIFLIISTLRRLSLYKNIVRMVFDVPGRWPRLMHVLKENRLVFLTWATFRPAILTFVLTVLYMIAARVIWPSATVTPADLGEHWQFLPFIVILGLGMLSFDLYGVIRAAAFNRDEITEHLDKAEYWLRSWKSPVVRFFTLGYVDPRRMVREEVHSAMMAARDLLNQTLWWMSTQLALRVVFGLSLWIVWILFPN